MFRLPLPLFLKFMPSPRAPHTCSIQSGQLSHTHDRSQLLHGFPSLTLLKRYTSPSTTIPSRFPFLFLLILQPPPVRLSSNSFGVWNQHPYHIYNICRETDFANPAIRKIMARPPPRQAPCSRPTPRGTRTCTRATRTRPPRISALQPPSPPSP